MKHILVSITTAVLLFGSDVLATSYGDIQRLMDTLFRNYSTLIRPSRDQGAPTIVELNFNIKQLESLDIKTQVMKTMGHFSINWTDDFLQWTREDFGGVKYITVPASKIWKPDYIINNDIASKRRLGDGNTLVVIESNGQILWEPGYVSSTVCLINIKYFPFDKQVCSIKVTSWMTSNISLRTQTTAGVTLTAYEENGEFEMLGAYSEHTRFPMTYLPEEELEGISFTVVLQRRTTFYWLSMIAPMMMFPFLSPLSFIVPTDSGEKTTLAITSLLSVFVFMSAMYDILPKLSNSVCYCVVLSSVQIVFSLLTVVCNVFILGVHRLPPQRPVSGCLKRILHAKTGPEAASALKKWMNGGQLLDQDVDKSKDGSDVTWAVVAEFFNRIFFIVFLVLVLVMTILFMVLLLNV